MTKQNIIVKTKLNKYKSVPAKNLILEVINELSAAGELIVDSSDVIDVTTIPTTGNVGTLYHNTTDNSYAVYDKNGNWHYFVKSSDSDTFEMKMLNYNIPIAQPAQYQGSPNAKAIYPNSYYDLGTLDDITVEETTVHPVIVLFDYDATAATQYCGRFTAGSDDLTIEIDVDNAPNGTAVHFPDNVPTIVADHVYEFNVMKDICLIVDITYTTV